MQNQIITFLKNSNTYISGEEISRRLKITRAAIWKNIEELRKHGYIIEAVPHKGYRLANCPDKLLPDEIQFHLGTKILGKDIVHYNSVESTMDAAFRLGMENAKEGTVVCAETQTKGKGRMGRSWVSPKGKGIYMSIILRPHLSPRDVAPLTLLSAVAVCEAVNKIAGVKAQIKWPNDLLINSKKVAGILTELSAEMDRVRFVVVGIGINVNTPINALPAHATSLKQETKRYINRVELLQEILRQTEKWYESLRAHGFGPVIERWKELASTLGKRVKLVDANGSVEGEAVGLDEFGGLIIRDDKGVKVKRMSGDVVHV